MIAIDGSRLKEGNNGILIALKEFLKALEREGLLEQYTLLVREPVQGVGNISQIIVDKRKAALAGIRWSLFAVPRVLKTHPDIDTVYWPYQ